MKIKLYISIALTLIVTLFSFMITREIIGPKEMEPTKVNLDEIEMRNVCKLATLEVYYHNVAKSGDVEKPGFLWIKKNMNFWLEYDGTVTLGIDTSLLEIDVSGTMVMVTIPDVKILRSDIIENSFTDESYHYKKDSVKATLEEQKKAVIDAKEYMEATAISDYYVLQAAQKQAKTIIEGYINNIGDIRGVDYEITWNYVNADGTPKE